MNKTVPLSMAAALVKFLQQQYIRRDGTEHRLINGVFGIFGHGNVTGFGQALEEFGGTKLPFSGQERTGHGPLRRRLRKNPPAYGHLRVH